jgi:alpha-tubulin suppressor-like RCC1 family protein
LLAAAALVGAAFAAQAAGPAEARLDAGEYRSCSVRDDGALACWGDANYGDYQPPAGRYFGLSVGFDHACALRGNGQIVCWGNPASIATPPPTGGFVAVSAGESGTCAVRSDGALRCWGNTLADTVPSAGQFLDVSIYGGRACAIRSDGALQCWQAPGIAGYSGGTPSGRFLQISLGNSHACALRSDGAAVCWGSNAQGQTAAPAATRFVAVTAGYQHSCGVREDGGLACWGANGSGQATPPAGRYAAVTAGRLHSCARDDEGAVRCWGTPTNGANNGPQRSFETLRVGAEQACGLNLDGDIACVGATNALTPPVRRYRDLSFGPTATCGLSLDGRAECWGQSLGATPSDVQFQAIAVGEAHVCAIRSGDGALQCWGDNRYGQATPPTGGYSAVVSGDRYSCAISDQVGTRRLSCWGQGAAVTGVPQNQYFYSMSAFGPNICGDAGYLAKFCWGADAAALQPPASNLSHFAVGARHVCAISGGGTVSCWGDNSRGQLNVPAGSGFYKVWAHGDLSCAYNNDGMRCWGAQTFSREGPGPRMAPVAIAAGEAHTCTVRGDRGVGCWGDNDFGQRNVPVHRAQALSANAEHSCSLRADGQALCWGDNTHDGATPSAQSLRALDLGQFNGCGVAATGNAQCWGWNVNDQSTPPAGLFRSLATGLNHSCGVRDDGTLACWGYNAEGQATAPAGAFKAVDVGERHSCAIRDDGSLQCWGLGSEGQTTPPDLGGATYRALAAGAFHNCAILSHGGVACWGRNAHGQSSPPDEGQYVSIAAGAAHTCAVRDDGARVCWGANERGQAPQLAVSPASLPMIRNAEPLALDFRLDASGGYAPPGTTFRIVGGKLPYGTYMSPAGQVRGTPADTPGDYSLTLEARDENGFLARQSYSYTLLRALDISPPSIQPLFNGSYEYRDWFNTNVQLSWDIRDDETPITAQSGCTTSNVTADTDGINFTCTATSEGGTATHTVVIRRDTVAPQTAFDGPQPPAFYGLSIYGYAPIRLAFAPFTDDRSGANRYECAINSTDDYRGCDTPYQTSFFFSNQPYRFYVRAKDVAGNVDPTPVMHEFYVRADTTAPVVTPLITGPLGDNGWYVGNVQLRWSIVDPETAITFTEGCRNRDIDFDSTEVFEYCRATSLPGQTTGYATIKRDTTAPAALATVSPAPNAAGWHRQNATVAYTCTETTSGLTAPCPASETIAQEGRNLSTTAKTVRDMAGNVGSSNIVTVNLDKTAPLVVSEPRTAANAFGWYRDDVVVDFVCTETLSGLAAPCPAAYTFTQQGRDLTYQVPVLDIAGNVGQAGRTLSIDRTAPSIVASATTAANAAGWYRANVSVAFACSDALSGLNGSCPAAQTLSMEGAAVASTAQTIQDYAGNTATSNVVTAKIDKTAPALVASVSPQANAAGWHRGNATVSYNCSDALSGIGVGACPADQLFSAETAGSTTFARTVADLAGNISAGSNQITVKIDKTAPTVSSQPMSAPNANGWYRSTVTVAVRCADAMSGVADCPNFEYLQNEGAAVSSTAWVVNDLAGNASAPSNVVTVKIDKTGPTMSATMPPPTLLLNATHDFQLSATDALSGIDSQSCGAMDTSTPGTRSVTCSAIDRAGNSVSRSSTYRVVYGYTPLSAPLTDPSQLYVVQAPRSVPFDVRLFDANGAAVTNATLAQATATDVACPSAGTPLTTPPAGETTSFQHLGAGAYRRNWWIDYTATGCVRLDFTLNDGVTRSATIRVVPKQVRTGGNYPSSRPPVPTGRAAPAQPVRSAPARPTAPNPRRPNLRGPAKK